jgi:hypothetical protein
LWNALLVRLMWVNKRRHTLNWNNNNKQQREIFMRIVQSQFNTSGYIVDELRDQWDHKMRFFVTYLKEWKNKEKEFLLPLIFNARLDGAPMLLEDEINWACNLKFIQFKVYYLFIYLLYNIIKLSQQWKSLLLFFFIYLYIF